MPPVNTNRDLRVVFMGTPEFAVASLEALLADGWNIVAVVTAPDKAGGRGMKLMSSAVKQAALKHRIPLLQPEKLKDPVFLEELRGYKADIQVVVAFRMLPELVWNMPPLGTINLHASLLPAYRGAAPINWAIMNGESVSGVTTFRLQQEIDTGNILLQEKVAIADTDNAGTLHDKLKETGAALLVQTLRGIADKTIIEIPQEQLQPDANKTSALPSAPKIFTGTCLIDWNRPVKQVYDHIRGLSPYPAAFTYIGEKMLKIYEARIILDEPVAAPGTIHSDQKTFLRFAALDGYIECLEIQLSGKKRMAADAFLRGNTIVT